MIFKQFYLPCLAHASRAAGLLRRNGFGRVSEIASGIAAWKAASRNLPVQSAQTLS